MADVAEHIEDVDGGVVVGVDGSRASHVALRRAGEEAAAHGLDLHVVPSYPEFESAVRDQLTKEVSEALGAQLPYPVHVHPVLGQAAKKLIEVSQSAGMLVVGSRGRGGFSGLVLGSTSEQVVRHAKCPVLVVHDHRANAG